MPKNIIADRIKSLEVEYGSLRAASRKLSIDVGYLQRLKSGEKSNPSDSVLKKLGLRKIVSYKQI